MLHFCFFQALLKKVWNFIKLCKESQGEPPEKPQKLSKGLNENCVSIKNKSFLKIDQNWVLVKFDKQQFRIEKCVTETADKHSLFKLGIIDDFLQALSNNISVSLY